MRLVQFLTPTGERRVARVADDGNAGDVLHVLRNVERVYDLALEASDRRWSLADMVADRAGDETVDYDAIISEKRLLPPLDHPNPAHFILSGTGLDHLGSAQTRNAMHEKIEKTKAGGDEELTDSMKMFQLGLEGGKPAPGEVGSQPEWFYKGDGSWVVPPGQPLELPAFALDGGEEPELVGLYVIDRAGTPLRVGFALGNEFSDHVLEKQNYLYLAHSKLRTSSFGPELLVGDPPDDIRGTSKLLRGDKAIWQGDFLTGEANMTHTLANIEHHHFKYARFRRPGDAHAHFFGTATLSFAAGVQAQPGDVFEISAPGFGRPLRNSLAAQGEAGEVVAVRTL